VDSTDDETETHDRDFVRALARGLAVIEALGGTQGPLGLAEVARRVDLSRGSTRRLLLTLIRLGYIEATESGRFQLLPAVLRLGYSYFSSHRVWELARPILRGLTDATNEACSVAVLDKHDVVYVARTAPREIMHDQVAVGSRIPAYCASLGRALLCDLRQSELEAFFDGVSLAKHTPMTETSMPKLIALIEAGRQNGYTISDQEIEVGLRSIAVPIRNPNGAIVAAMNVSAKVARVALDELVNTHLPLLRGAAQELSAVLRTRGL
jgi:IclR family pca regulon transcriptional regulator